MRWITIAAIAISLGGVGAARAANRIWVSGHGVDQAGCGAPTAPCRSLQFAHDNVVAGGEVDILDPAGYGSLTINKAISIVNDGVGTAGIQATSGRAILIDAGPGDAVVLKGLNIDGVQKSGLNGVVVIGAGVVTIENCVVAHFANTAIGLGPLANTLNATISNTRVEGNAEGVSYNPNGGSATTNIVIDHVTAINNTDGGLRFASAGTGHGHVTVANSVSSGNAFGLLAMQLDTSSLAVVVDSTYLDNNSDGLFADTAAVFLERSVIAGNAFGVNNFNGAGTGIVSFGDNVLRDNGTNLSVALTTATLN